MSTGYGWEGLRQVGATLLGMRHVPERLCGGLDYLEHYCYNKCSPLPSFTFIRCLRVERENVKTFVESQNSQTCPMNVD